jgi:putative peptidoglycan lipid II flippase
VYVGLRKREGAERANAYASTLMGVVLVFLGAVALLATVFAPQVVWTQMFLNDSGDRELVTYFFRFFAVQLVFYGVSAVVGGLLNARRDYVWSSAAPIANNVVVIAVMFVYVFVAPRDPELGKLFLAVGTPLGVFVQMALQIPALAKNGVHLRPWRVDLHDPALRETLSLGLPTLVVTLASFVTVSVQNAAAMAVSDAGSSVLFYARQWFTLPYAFFSVPITTALFTELSDLAADGDTAGVRRCVVGGTQQNLLFMVPFALYLMVFSVPLVSLFQAGSFSWESVRQVAGYLSVMAVSLPFYALFLFMQKTFSALRRMGVYAAANVAASAVQVALTLLLCLGAGEAWDGWGLPGIAVAQTAFFVLGCAWCYAYLHRLLGGVEGAALARGFAGSLVLGGLGAAAGAGVLWLLCTFVAPLGGSITRSLAYVAAGGAVSLAVTYGLAVRLHVPGSEFIGRLVGKVLCRR